MDGAQLFILRDEEDEQRLYAFLKENWRAHANTEKPLCVSVSRYIEKRSTAQNKRLWAMLNEISQQAWVGDKQFSKEIWHYEYAGHFLGWEETPSGKQVPISTTTLDREEFGRYLTQIEVHSATEYGVVFQR